MNHEETLALLDDFVSGDLSPRENDEVEAHLHECAGCREEVAALEALLADAAALPRGIAPPRDLWAGIEARIAPAASHPEGEDDVKVIPLRPRPRWRPPQWVTAMAASVVLVVGSSLVTMRVMESRETAAPTLPGVVVAPQAQAAPGQTQTAFAAFAPAERDYQQAIAELQAVLQVRRARLAPETVRTLETNLAIIDAAIQESREALAADPDSGELTQMLSSVYETKMQMLQKAVEL